MLEYIDGLPKTSQRGLQLPTDSTGYYIVWPDRSFYKKRLFEGKTRYIGPRGHKVPLFTIPGDKKNLIFIEGEINAMTLSELSGLTIASPGSATELPKHLSYCLQFDTIVIIVDKDVPGVANGLKLKDELIKRGKRTQLIAVERDFNEIFQEEGQEGLQKFIKENVGMPAWMQDG